MIKPLSIRISELNQDITEAINRSELPPIIARYVIKEIDQALAQAQRQQELEERRAWEEDQGQQDLTDKIQLMEKETE